MDKYVKKKKAIVFEKRRKEKYESEKKKANSQKKIDKMQGELEQIKMQFYQRSNRRRAGNAKVSPAGQAESFSPKAVSGRTTVYAFITFRSMHGYTLYERAYKEF